MEKKTRVQGEEKTLLQEGKKTGRNSQKRTAKEKGDWGEKAALNFYLKRGFHLIKKNFRGPHGEIDLILEKSNRLYFVEVKSRSYYRRGRPAEACDFRKRRRLIHTAQIFLSKDPERDWEALSFEIIEVNLVSQRLTRIPQAFSLEEGN